MGRRAASSRTTSTTTRRSDRSATLVVRRALPRLFAFRHRRTHGDLVRQSPFAGRPPMRIAVTGREGLIGRELVPFLTTAGHDGRAIVRRPPPGRVRSLGSRTGPTRCGALEGVDAVVHLAGESIDTVDSARSGASATAASTARCCSADARRSATAGRARLDVGVNYYGERATRGRRGRRPATGSSRPRRRLGGGTARPATPGSASSTCATGSSCRAAAVRWRRCCRPFRLGLGGTIGDGDQFVSWIAIDDLVGAIYQALHDERLTGPVNLVAPEPVTNRRADEDVGAGAAPPGRRADAGRRP